MPGVNTVAEMQVKIDADVSGVEKGVKAAEKSVGGLGSSMKSGLGGLVSGFGTLGLAVGGVGAAIDGIKGAGNAIFGLGALNDIEQVKASFNAFTKDAGKTDEILKQVREEATKGPFAFKELAQATAALMPAAKQAKVPLEELQKTAEILAASNPQQGLEGAAFALKEAVSGDFQSVIERFNLPRQRLKELKEQGVPDLQAVQMAMKEMGFDADLIAAKGETLSGRWSTFQDTLETVTTKMGQPIFDVLKEGLTGLQGALDENMPAIEGFADAIAGGLTSAISGVREAFQTVGPIIADAWRTVQQVFEGNWSPDDSINPFVNAIGKIAVAVRDDVLPVVRDFIDFINTNVMPAVKAVAGFILEQVGKVVTWFVDNFPLMAKTFSAVVGQIKSYWSEHGEVIMTVIQLAWDNIKTVIGTTLDVVLGLIKATMQLITGDWEGAWETIKGLVAEVIAAIGHMFENDLKAAFAVIDHVTGGALTTVKTWIDDVSKALSLAWDAIKAGIDKAWTAAGGIVETIGGAWDATKKATDDALNAAGTGIVALAAAGWDAVKTGMDKVFGAGTGDTITGLAKAGWTVVSGVTKSLISGDTDSALAYAKAGWDLVKSNLDAVFGKGTGDTITGIAAAGWTAISAGAKALMDDPSSGVKAILSAAWTAVKLALDAVFGKGTGDTITGVIQAGWDAIGKAADAVFGEGKGVRKLFADAMDVMRRAVDPVIKILAGDNGAGGLIGFITKLKDIMPAWLIPHSPTPFQVGLEGIMKAAQGMNSAFGGMGGGLATIQQIAGMATQIGGVDFGRAAAAIAASETGGGASLVQQGGTGAVGPFQFDPGGELRNFARDLHVSMAEAARIAVSEPMRAAMWALQGYLGTALRAGIGEGLSGAALAMYGSRYGQRPFGDNWKKAGEWYERLFPGLAEGGIVTRPTLAMVGEGRYDEAVLPLPRDWRNGGQSGPPQVIRLDVAIGGQVAKQIVVEGYDLAVRRGWTPGGLTG